MPFPRQAAAKHAQQAAHWQWTARTGFAQYVHDDSTHSGAVIVQDAAIHVYMAGCEDHCVSDMHKTYSYYAIHFITSGAIHLAWSPSSEPEIHQAPLCWTGWPGQYVAIRSAEPCTHYRTALVGATISAWHQEGLLPRRVRSVIKLDRAQELWQYFIEKSSCRTPLERRQACNAMEAFLLDLADPMPERADTPLHALRQQIDDDPFLTPAYLAWAKRMDVSLATLRRRFLAQFGTPIHRYIIERRCAVACHLLQTDQRPLQEIADELGYRDVYYFSRQFRQVIGMSPGAYRQLI